MPKNRKDLISQLINEGFTHRTLSSFSDNQIKALRNKLLGEDLESEIKNTKEKLADLTLTQADEKILNRIKKSNIYKLYLTNMNDFEVDEFDLAEMLNSNTDNSFIRTKFFD